MPHSQKLQHALALHLQGDFGPAQSLYEEILRAQPEHFDALRLLAAIAAQNGNPSQAADLIGRAVAAEPDHALAFFYRASILYENRQLEAALVAYGRAIELEPGLTEAHMRRGDIRYELGRLHDALADYDDAIAIEPDDSRAHFNRAVLLGRFGQLEAALESYDRAIELKTDYAEAHYNRGNVLHRLKQWGAALASYNQAIASRHDFAEAYANRAVVQSELQQVEAALASCDAAIAIKDDHAEAHSNRGFLLQELRQWDAALESCNRAIAIKADYAEPYFNRSIVRLLHGDFEQGWLDYEWRPTKQQGTDGRDEGLSAQPRWLGLESLDGKTILIHSEQGFGDTLQFCRYVKLLADRGATVILQVQAPLAGLLSRLQGVAQLLTAGDPPDPLYPLPNFDYHCPLLSLPLAFKTDLHTIPVAPKYLFAAASKVSQWQEKLGQKGKIRIGLAWSGNSGNKRDQYRSIGLAELLRHLPTEFQYVALQKDIRELDQETLRLNPQVLNFAAEQQDFNDAAALCECMDLIVSVDTSMAHLGGALGKETWILLSSTPDWRWLLDRIDSPWYPSVTLYRQETHAEWGAILERLKLDLRRRFNRGPFGVESAAPVAP